jgi:hypothetical protein
MTNALLIMIFSCVILVSIPNILMTLFIQFGLKDAQIVWTGYLGKNVFIYINI